MHVYAHLHKLGNLSHLKSELSEIYLNQVMQTFALSLVGIFVPMYLLDIGYDLSMVIQYYAIFAVLVSGLAFVTSKLSTRLGLKHTIFLSTIPMAAEMVVLEVLGHYQTQWLFYLVPVLEGIWTSLYWLPLHAEFIKNSHKIREGSEVASLFAFPKLAATFAPFFGALILTFAGFDALFIIVVILILLSAGPLFFTPDLKSRFHFRYKDFRPLLGNRVHFYLAAEGIQLLSEVILWPVMVYMLFGNIMSIGILATISSITIVVFTFLAGRIANKQKGGTRLLRLGGLLYGASLIARAFVADMASVYIYSFIGSVFSTLMVVGIYAKFCDEGRRGNIVAAATTRHVWLGIGRLPVMFLVTMIFGLQPSLVVAGLLIGLLCLL
jgi:MFS family permease